MADTEIDGMTDADETPLGDALPIADFQSDFMSLEEMNDFSFLETEDDEEEKGEEGEEDKKPADKAAKTDAPAADPPEDNAIADKLAAYDRLDAALRENPGQAVRAIFAGMSATDRSALSAELGLVASNVPERENFDVNEYEPQGEMEQALASRWGDVESIPAIRDTITGIERNMEQGFGAFVPHVTDANIAAQIALSKVEALCEALQIALPDPDSAEIIKILQSGKTTYRDAVRSVTNYKGQVDAHKQTRAPRPQTPGGGPRNTENIPMGTDAVTIAKRLGLLPRR
jgi:hypothetical protein